MSRFVKHVNRPEWGRGLIVSENANRNIVAFENAGAKTIGQEYSSLLVEEIVPDDEAQVLEERLRRAPAPPPKPSTRKANTGRASKGPPTPVMTFDDQVRLFWGMFPKGFDDDRFVTEERGLANDKSPAKYKQRAIDTAQRLLDKEMLRTAVDRGAYDEIHANAHTILKRSDNLTHWLSDGLPFSNMMADRHATFALALRAMLYDEGPMPDRFDRLVDALNPGDTTWPLATLFPALHDPKHHYFVRPTVADKQATILAIEPMRKKRPEGSAYERFLDMARRVDVRLRERGLNPRDLMDVYSFTWRTLSDKSDTDAPMEPARPAEGS
jgi:hypothetical protein